MILTVLDYTTGSVHIYEYKEPVDTELFMEEKGHKVSDCHHMTTETLNLKISTDKQILIKDT